MDIKGPNLVKGIHMEGGGGYIGTVVTKFLLEKEELEIAQSHLCIVTFL